MTKKEFLGLIENRDWFLKCYRLEPDHGPNKKFYAEEYSKFFNKVKDVLSVHPNFKELLPEYQEDEEVVQKRENVVLLENTYTQLKFAYEKEFKNYNIWETSSYGVITITKLGPGVFGYNKEGWNIMQGEVSQMDIIDIHQVKVKTRTYKISSKIIKLK